MELKDNGMPADVLVGNVDLPDTVIFNTAYCTGSEPFAKTFIEGNAIA